MEKFYSLFLGEKKPINIKNHEKLENKKFWFSIIHTKSTNYKHAQPDPQSPKTVYPTADKNQNLSYDRNYIFSASRKNNILPQSFGQMPFINQKKKPSKGKSNLQNDKGKKFKITMNMSSCGGRCIGLGISSGKNNDKVEDKETDPMFDKTLTLDICSTIRNDINKNKVRTQKLKRSSEEINANRVYSSSGSYISRTIRKKSSKLIRKNKRYFKINGFRCVTPPEDANILFAKEKAKMIKLLAKGKSKLSKKSRKQSNINEPKNTGILNSNKVTKENKLDEHEQEQKNVNTNVDVTPKNNKLVIKSSYDSNRKPIPSFEFAKNKVTNRLSFPKLMINEMSNSSLKLIKLRDPNPKKIKAFRTILNNRLSAINQMKQEKYCKYTTPTICSKLSHSSNTGTRSTHLLNSDSSRKINIFGSIQSPHSSISRASESGFGTSSMSISGSFNKYARNRSGDNNLFNNGIINAVAWIPKKEESTLNDDIEMCLDLYSNLKLEL
ncbi:hypothetical protein BB558_003550 [Smittium angustum]|uniref:Uncharacterized protein n=1 Tax=Smittium angustum TaxID=133377 RepID=A0A2U1J5P2_SMIAN|nr:hypothetical protein BB558_003550 [Smittium angustum]